jgi:hypothetical protein
MKQILHLVGFVLVLLKSNAQTISPQTLNTSGGYINLGYHQIEWNIGESSVIETFIQNTINGAILTNGVLQPLTDKPFIVNEINKWANDEIRIFPNTTTGNFEVNILSKQQGLLYMQLVDALGANLKKVSYYYYGYGNIERFNITNLASGTYFLNVQLSPFPGNVKKAGSYKIIKIN